MESQAQDATAVEATPDPFQYYAWLRENEPVSWNETSKAWFLSRHEDVSWLVRQPKLFSSENWKKDLESPLPPIEASDADSLTYVAELRSHEFIQNDPPEHTRMRSAVHSEFTTRAIENLRSMICSAVDRLLGALSDKTTMDVVADLAKPLPLLVISEMMGVPLDDREVVKDQADRRMASALSIAPDRMRDAAEGIRASDRYFNGQIDERLREPKSDLLSLLAGAEREGKYSREEVLANAQMLIDAGHETTIRLICNGILALLRNEEQWDFFRSDPDGLAATTTEECLRYDPPLPQVRRVARTDVVRDGKAIHAGDRVIGIIAAANRDPRVFKNPDSFEINRSPNNHLAFIAGIHYCLGQYLARVEGQEVFKALATRFPDLRLTEKAVQYREDRRSRFIKSLKVEWG